MAKIKRKKSLYQRAKESRAITSAETVVLPLLFLILLLVMWQTQVLHTILRTDTFTLPLPGRIIGILVENAPKVWLNVKATMTVAILGLVFGSILGYGIAILAAVFPIAGKGGLSVIGAFASIPVVALAPVFNNWTKDVSVDAGTRSMVSKIIVVSLIAAANMGLNAYRGLTELKPYAMDLMATYATKKRVSLLKLRIPNSIPYLFIAFKVSVPASIMTAIVSEYFAEVIIGVGRQIRENIVLAQYSAAWAYIAVSCLLGIVSYIIILVLQKLLLRKYH